MTWKQDRANRAAREGAQTDEEENRAQLGREVEKLSHASKVHGMRFVECPHCTVSGPCNVCEDVGYVVSWDPKPCGPACPLAKLGDA